MLLLIFVLLLNAISDSLLVFDFNHTLRDVHGTDTSMGYVYRSDSIFVIRVTKPVNQTIYFSGDTMMVVYPAEKRAFKIKSGFTLQFQTPAGPSSKLGTTLKKAGFIFVKRERTQDTVKEVWMHPKTKSMVIYEFSSEMLRAVTFLNEKRDSVLTVKYDSYVNFDGKQIPLVLSIKSGVTEEVYRLSNPRKIVFADSIKRFFEIGKDFKVEIKGFDK